MHVLRSDTSRNGVDHDSLLPCQEVRSAPAFSTARSSAAQHANPFASSIRRHSLKNPVMFVVEAGAVLTTVCDPRCRHGARIAFALQITLWLWFTVLFANFAEAMAEARGKAQADSLRKTKTDSVAKKVIGGGRIEQVAASQLRAGDVVLARPGDMIPGDGEVIEGIATVDESVITGESAPVIRESGGDRSAVTGGTKVLSDRIRSGLLRTRAKPFLIA